MSIANISLITPDASRKHTSNSVKYELTSGNHQRRLAMYSHLKPVGSKNNVSKHEKGDHIELERKCGEYRKLMQQDCWQQQLC